MCFFFAILFFITICFAFNKIKDNQNSEKIRKRIAVLLMSVVVLYIVGLFSSVTYLNATTEKKLAKTYSIMKYNGELYTKENNNYIFKVQEISKNESGELSTGRIETIKVSKSDLSMKTGNSNMLELNRSNYRDSESIFNKVLYFSFCWPFISGSSDYTAIIRE